MLWTSVVKWPIALVSLLTPPHPTSRIQGLGLFRIRTSLRHSNLQGAEGVDPLGRS